MATTYIITLFPVDKAMPAVKYRSSKLRDARDIVDEQFARGNVYGLACIAQFTERADDGTLIPKKTIRKCNGERVHTRWACNQLSLF